MGRRRCAARTPLTEGPEILAVRDIDDRRNRALQRVVPGCFGDPDDLDIGRFIILQSEAAANRIRAPKYFLAKTSLTTATL